MPGCSYACLAGAGLSGWLQVTDGEIGPADIVQGALGDCYFLSALRYYYQPPAKGWQLEGGSDSACLPG